MFGLCVGAFVIVFGIVWYWAVKDYWMEWPGMHETTPSALAGTSPKCALRLRGKKRRSAQDEFGGGRAMK